ncbi:hypothetical protein Tco_1375749 [Tanacetum coccineum]
MEDHTVIRQQSTTLAKGYVHNQTDSLNLIILNKVYRSKKALYGIETSSEARCRSCRFALILAKELLENTVPSNVKRTQLQRLRASPTTKYRCIVTLSQAMQSHATRNSTPVPSTSLLAFLKKGSSISQEKIGMRCLTPAELEVLTKESA